MFKKVLLLVLFSASTALAMPAQVILIRHGEKPDTGNELNQQGFERAKALPGFLLKNSVVNQFGAISAIFAMAPKDKNGSVRAIETVQPFSDQTGIKIRQKFLRDDVKQLVKKISDSKYDGQTVLICWEHSVIPEIAAAFGAKSAPASWDGGNVFDRAWILTFKNDQIKFQDIPEHVLPGDSN